MSTRTSRGCWAAFIGFLRSMVMGTSSRRRWWRFFAWRPSRLTPEKDFKGSVLEISLDDNSCLGIWLMFGTSDLGWALRINIFPNLGTVSMRRSCHLDRNVTSLCRCWLTTPFCEWLLGSLPLVTWNVFLESVLSWWHLFFLASFEVFLGCKWFKIDVQFSLQTFRDHVIRTFPTNGTWNLEWEAVAAVFLSQSGRQWSDHTLDFGLSAWYFQAFVLSWPCNAGGTAWVDRRGKTTWNSRMLRLGENWIL